MTLDQIKRDAIIAANEVEIEWDMMEQVTYRDDFLYMLESGTKFVLDLEHLYTKLVNHESILHDGPSALPYEDVEQYLGLVEMELRCAYVLQEIRHKYDMITNVIQDSKNYPLTNSN